MSKDHLNNISQITACNDDWFLVHDIGEGKLSIYPVAVWATIDDQVVGLIGVENDEGCLISPPPGKVSYKKKSELTEEQVKASYAGKVAFK